MTRDNNWGIVYKIRIFISSLTRNKIKNFPPIRFKDVLESSYIR